jgi:alkylation response protein AidB-like acyl-CoA dehydrogenase
VQFAFTEDQRLFQETVREILANECPPTAVRDSWTNDTGRVPGLWQLLADTGVVGLTVPEALGGLGMTEVDLVLLLEEFGRAAAPEPLLEHTAVGVPLLRDHAPDAVAAEWLPRAASGEAVLAVGLEGRRYVLGGAEADLLLLQHGDALHAVPRDRATCTPQTSVDQSRRLVAVDWTPSPDTLLVDGLEGRQAAEDAFDRGALAAAAQCIGVAQQLLDLTVAYVAEREQFGRPVGVHQAVKHHLADVAIALEFARPMVYVAAWSVAGGAPSLRREVSTAKALASDCVDRAARAALQCHGAIGYTIEYDLQLWLKRGWALAAAWGDAAWHRRRVADELSLPA